jgi:hypothetical protein
MNDSPSEICVGVIVGGKCVHLKIEDARSSSRPARSRNHVSLLHEEVATSARAGLNALLS